MLESIFLLSPRGSCAGVIRAITAVERAVSVHGHPIYVLHEIVHNSYEINRLKSMGVLFVESLKDIPSGSVVVFSAHGVPVYTKKLAYDLGLKFIDATCPLVSNTHFLVKNCIELGDKIFIIGQKNHAEVIGIAGCVNNAKDSIFIIESEDDINLLPNYLQDKKISYVTQSTLNVDFVDTIISLLKYKFPQIESCSKKNNNNICYATKSRQKVMKSACRFIDFALILGSKNSSNSLSLLKIALENNVRAQLIDGLEDFQSSLITKDIKKIAITASASAPEILVEKIVDHIKAEHNNAEIINFGAKEFVNFKELKVELEK